MTEQEKEDRLIDFLYLAIFIAVIVTLGSLMIFG